VTEEHDRIEELLAGYVLRSLSGEDAIRADRLLSEHVPSCPTCRRTLAELRELAGELGLAAGASSPPTPLLQGIRRRIDGVARPSRLPRRVGALALAASVVALAITSGLSVSLGSRAREAEAQRGTALEMLSLMGLPGTEPVDLDPQGGTPDRARFVQVSAPQVRRIYLAARECPDPAPGHAYQLWLGSGGTFVPIGEMFRPVDGVVLLTLTLDVSRYDEIWITEEPVGDPPPSPSPDGRSWRAEL